MYTKKNSSKKILVAVLAIVLVLGCAVGGTLAWLSAKTDAIENTFTAGNITITLTETFNSNDKWVGKIVPGGKEAKDPKITVEIGSEKCYVYALVENNMKVGNTVAVTPDINTTDWIEVGTSGNQTLYRYKEVVDASAEEKVIPVFTEVSYDGALITEENIGELAAKTIKVDAFAHQSENTNQDVADAAAKAHFGFPTT